MSSNGRRASKSADVDIAPAESVYMRPKSAQVVQSTASGSSNGGSGSGSGSGSGTGGREHGVPQLVADANEGSENGTQPQEHLNMDLLRRKKRTWFAYVRTKEFWVVLALGQYLSVSVTATNTLSYLLAEEGTNIPAFQNLFNYILLNLIYTSYTIYKYGFKKWFRLLYKDGWRFFILSFMDVQGNYFTVLAYRYTSILSCQLINFWAIVVVVLISVIFLHVRYHIAQYAGIIICIGGMGILLASDHINHANGGDFPTAVKGDMWALGGATFYGLSNVFEEFLVSERPLYEVVGQLGFWGMFIMGTQAAIFDRSSFRSAVWNSTVGGYLTGYTLILSAFYSFAPLLFRLASAAFFNLSLLTGNFWGVAIGTTVFGLSIHWMYPIALVLIIIGHVVYFMTESVLGEARKPWLGERQERGVSGVGTARRQDEVGGFLGMGVGKSKWGIFKGRLQRGGNVTEGTPGPGVV